MDRITFIGSGNVATNLAKAFFEHGFEIVQIYSRTINHALELADKVNAGAICDLAKLLPADVYIVAVSDDAIGEVVGQIQAGNSLVLHTAGSVDISALESFPHHGVLYPLQTFTKGKKVDFSQIPFFIEGNSLESLERIRVLATAIFPYVKQLDSDKRLKLHVAAVFACNFLNYLLGVAADLSGENFTMLHSLVMETVEKALSAKHPKEVQTGPALRNDIATLEKHKKILSSHPELQHIYSIISQSILNHV